MPATAVSLSGAGDGTAAACAHAGDGGIFGASHCCIFGADDTAEARGSSCTAENLGGLPSRWELVSI